MNKKPNSYHSGILDGLRGFGRLFFMIFSLTRQKSGLFSAFFGRLCGFCDVLGHQEQLPIVVDILFVVIYIS